MKTMIVVVLFGVIAMVASQRGVQVVDQNPGVEAGVGGFSGIILDRVTSLKSRVHDRTNRVLTLLGVNIVDHNSPSPTPIQVVDNSNGVNVVDNNPYPTPVHVVENSHSGVNVVDNNPYPTPVHVVENSHSGVNVVDNNPYPTPVHVVENSHSGGHNADNIYPTPVKVVDNSHNGVHVVDNSPYHGNQQDGLVNVDPGFGQPGIGQNGYVKPHRRIYGTNKPYIPNRPGDQVVIENVDPGFGQPGIGQGVYVPGRPVKPNRPGNQGPDSDVYYRRQQSPWLREGK